MKIKSMKFSSSRIEVPSPFSSCEKTTSGRKVGIVEGCGKNDTLRGRESFYP